MLSLLEIESFKSFPGDAVAFRDLTLLCGFNNSGKSSIIQALRMFCNAHEMREPLLPGHGSIDELRSKLAPVSAPIVFRGHFDDESVSEYILSDSDFQRPDKSPICYFLSADRLGPQVALPVEQRLKRFPTVGPRGEYVVGFLEALRNFIVPEPLRHKKAQGVTLEYQLVGWLEEIAPGVELKYGTDKKRDSAYFEFNSFRPSNVGFGLSYCLPILAIILGLTASPPSAGWKDTELGDTVGLNWEKERAKRGVLVLIENPEAHLHPKGQTALGKFIALGAMCGVQFVIETQSDHLMDGIRIAVKGAGGASEISTTSPSAASAGGDVDGTGAANATSKSSITPENVLFHYLEKDATGHTQIQTPVLDAKGKLSFWPEGFFDQTLKNRSVLAK